MISTLVVEDDPVLAEAHCMYVKRVPGFSVAAVAHTGGDALRIVATQDVDLVLLDFFLPDMGGLDVCRTLRARGDRVDVIAVTSARDLDVVRAAVEHGVVQYLLKPFSFPSFREKLDRYAEYRRRVTAAPADVAQQDVDGVLEALRTPAGPSLPKGLSGETLTAVVARLHDGGEVTAADVADAVGISRPTARRYLEYLTAQRLTARDLRYGGSGRPEHLYRWSAR